MGAYEQEMRGKRHRGTTLPLRHAKNTGQEATGTHIQGLKKGEERVGREEARMERNPPGRL